MLLEGRDVIWQFFLTQSPTVYNFGFDDILMRELIWQLKSISHKALNLFQFDCEITLQSVPGTNQY